MTPLSKIPVPKLPLVTFFAGGPQLLRTEVANILADITPGGQAHSFAAPVREGTLGTFFFGDPAIDVSKLGSVPILPRDGSPTFGSFMAAYSQFMASFFSDASILGLLAVRTVEENRPYFDTLIFDDADTKENVRVVADVFGRSEALIVNFGEPSLRSRSIPVITLPEQLPREPLPIIDYLTHTLSPRTKPVVISSQPQPQPKDDLDDLL